LQKFNLEVEIVGAVNTGNRGRIFQLQEAFRQKILLNTFFKACSVPETTQVNSSAPLGVNKSIVKNRSAHGQAVTSTLTPQSLEVQSAIAHAVPRTLSQSLDLQSASCNLQLQFAIRNLLISALVGQATVGGRGKADVSL